MEDSAKFMAHVKFDDISEDLTAPNAPWIYYGVRLCATYPCAGFSLASRGLTPELELPTCESYTQIWSSEQSLRAVSVSEFPPTVVLNPMFSAAVTHASIELWEYMDVIRRFADPRCSRDLEKLAVAIDSMLSQSGTRQAIKSLFGLSALEHDYDFIATIEVGI